jgi:hypothetical protein
MEFEDQITLLAEKVRNQHAATHTEEATKTAFVMPFISRVLGYDVFNPVEVIPEFTADFGMKRGEKVDYAIMRDNEVQILIECKTFGDPLDIATASQLYRYFSVTNARNAVLTNGARYQFYTDLDSRNRMDNKPFLVLDLDHVDEMLLPELKKLAKEAFDLDSVLSAAEELKYVGSIKRAIADEFRDPNEDFVRFFVSRIYDGRFTHGVREQFTPLVAKATHQFLKEQVNERLKTALSPGETEGSGTPNNAQPDTGENSENSGDADFNVNRNDTEITSEELQAYRIVKAIACREVKPHRIGYRALKSYCAILLDDNNRKTIARLRFNSANHKHIGIFDENKEESQHQVCELDDIYQHAENIQVAARILIA